MKSKAASEWADRTLANELDYNKAWYNRHYNEDATQRADAQRVLNMAMERIKANNRAAAGTDAVMGSDTQSKVKEQSAQTVANIMADIAAKGADRKDQVDAQYEANRKSIKQQQIANKMQNAANIGAAGQGVAQAAIGAGQAYDEWKQQGEYNEIMKLLMNNKNQNPIT
jgi:hypothetical protein